MKYLPRYLVDPPTDAIWAVMEDMCEFLHVVRTHKNYTKVVLLAPWTNEVRKRNRNAIFWRIKSIKIFLHFTLRVTRKKP